MMYKNAQKSLKFSVKNCEVVARFSRSQLSYALNDI